MNTTPGTIALVGELLRPLSVAGLGAFAGAMLTEGVVLVPYWRALSPSQFFTWYAANDARLLGFFGPLTALVGFVTLAAAGASFSFAHPGRWWALGAAASMFVAILLFPIYFQGANTRFACASIAPDDLAAELTRWAAWHRVRTVLAVAALAASLLAL